MAFQIIHTDEYGTTHPKAYVKAYIKECPILNGIGIVNVEFYIYSNKDSKDNNAKALNKIGPLQLRIDVEIASYLQVYNISKSNALLINDAEMDYNTAKQTFDDAVENNDTEESIVLLKKEMEDKNGEYDDLLRFSIFIDAIDV